MPSIVPSLDAKGAPHLFAPQNCMKFAKNKMGYRWLNLGNLLLLLLLEKLLLSLVVALLSNISLSMSFMLFKLFKVTVRVTSDRSDHANGD